MNEYIISQKLARLEKQMDSVAEILKAMEGRLSAEENLWDNADMIRQWKVSARTLADWRSKKLIGYTQINGKIYYKPEDRIKFLSNHHINFIQNELQNL